MTTLVRLNLLSFFLWAWISSPWITCAFIAVPSARSPTQKNRGRLYQKAPRHDVGPPAAEVLPPPLLKQMEAYQEHQQNAPKLDWATDVRTLVQYNHGYAVLSTFSKAEPKFPGGSVVGFAPNPTTGKPYFFFSGMSSHTQDILANPHCSLTVAAKGFKGAADARVNLMGKAQLVKDPEEIQLAQELYLKKHPNAFWVKAGFGDFNWFTMSVEHIRFVGGFARAGSVTAEEYAAARADPVSEYGPDIAKHMNEDHMEATIAMVKANIPAMTTTTVTTEEGEEEVEVPVITAAEITAVDSLGMFVKVTREAPVAFLPQQFKVRLPFPRQAADRKDIKGIIMEMTMASAQAEAAPQKETEAA